MLADFHSHEKMLFLLKYHLLRYNLKIMYAQILSMQIDQFWQMNALVITVFCQDRECFCHTGVSLYHSQSSSQCFLKKPIISIRFSRQVFLYFEILHIQMYTVYTILFLEFLFHNNVKIHSWYCIYQ